MGRWGAEEAGGAEGALGLRLIRTVLEQVLDDNQFRTYALNCHGSRSRTI
ncbi:MAG: hypothetical protein F6K14_16475 [Symploca sp. SIO2C1]|nr:hypothetical protein [Symploca sp. SIO2C1]